MNEPHPIYLDYNATAPIDARVTTAMQPYLTERFGNASSAHAYGYQARMAVEEARAKVARLLGANPDEVVFTGGGSESDNLALKGAVLARLENRPHVITSATEHPAILNTLRYLKRRFGVAFTLAPVDEFGVVSVDAIREAIRPETVLITVMHGNNEVGTLQPIEQIGTLARDAGILFHVDAAQTAGKRPIDVATMHIDLLTVAGHKLYAPKGVGALYIRRGVQIDPLVHGASQEHGLRAGTENTASMVALGLAAEIAREELPEELPRLTALRDRLHQHLSRRIPDLELNGHPQQRLANTLNVSFPGVTGQAVLQLTPEVAASTGSACHSGMAEPSPVLLSMGLAPGRAVGAVRLSLGRWSTPDEVSLAADALARGFALAGGTQAAAS